MGKTWDLSDGDIHEEGHKWVYVATRDYGDKIMIEFRCANGCPTKHIRGVSLPDSDHGVCFTPLKDGT